MKCRVKFKNCRIYRVLFTTLKETPREGTWPTDYCRLGPLTRCSGFITPCIAVFHTTKLIPTITQSSADRPRSKLSGCCVPRLRDRRSRMRDRGPFALSRTLDPTRLNEPIDFKRG